MVRTVSDTLLPIGTGSGPSAISDARLRLLFESNIVGILIANNAGAVIEANEAFLAMIGYTREELTTGRVDWRTLTPPEWLPLDERAIADMAANGRFAQYEKEYVRKDGTRVPISLGGARIPGTDDEQICYIVDLSEIRRTEAALRRSESRYNRLSDANLIGIVRVRLDDDRVVEANAEFLRIVGVKPDAHLRGCPRWSELTPADWRPAANDARGKLRTSRRFTPYEQEFVRADGTRVPVLVGGALLEDSDVEALCCVLDLSEQRETLLQLRGSERRYRVLAEALPQMVLMADETRRIVYVNRYYEEYTGVSLAEVSERWRDPIHPDDLAAISRARSSGEPYEVEYRVRRAADGVYRWHLARAMPVPGDVSGTHWLSTAMDIDDRKRAEDALRFLEKAGSRLSQSLDLETTFATLMDLVVPELGDWASISLRDEERRIKLAVARHKDPEKTRMAQALCGLECYLEDGPIGTPAVYTTGAAQLRSHVGTGDLARVVKPQYLAAFEQLGYGSLVALPIFSGGEVIGSFGIVSDGGARTYTAADLPALEELARRAGFAIANAREYEREHRVASMLQEAALPRQLPAVAGLRFDAFYQAGRREALIGGDWFDALLVPDGRVVISVGDVAGSGLRAAVLMGNVRQVLRGAAHVFPDPMMMLDVADRTLGSEHDQSMVTAFVAVIDPVRRTMLYASAGHLPALLRAPDGAITALDAPGLPLGCRSLAAGESRSTLLPPGSCLLLYTDGLVEWGRDLVTGEALLRERFAAACAADESHPAKALVRSILGTATARDDVAVLTVSIDR